MSRPGQLQQVSPPSTATPTPTGCSGATAAPQKDSNFLVLRLNGQGPEPKLQARQYQKRKAHAKSRTGCLSCKGKAVKCDELKPSCKRCVRNRWQCVYPSAATPAGSSPERGRSSTKSISPIPTSPEVKLEPPTTDALILNSRTQLACIPVSDAARSCPSSSSNRYASDTTKMALLQHFQRHPREVLGVPAADAVLKLGMAQPYLLDAVMAVAASHLRFHTPNDNTRHRVAELNMQTVALRGFQQSLISSSLDQESSDALLLSSLIMNLLSFSAVEDEDVTTSWVFDSDRQRLGWFTILAGYWPVRAVTKPFHARSIMAWMFALSDDKAIASPEGGEQQQQQQQQEEVEGRGGGGGVGGGDNRHRLADVPAHWLRLCGLLDDTTTATAFISYNDSDQQTPPPTTTKSPSSPLSSSSQYPIINTNTDTKDNNLFYQPVRVLSSLRRVPAHPGTFFLYLAFFGTLDAQFRSLLEARDVRALWLIGYWLGLLCRFANNLWWIQRKAWKDYRAVKLWFAQRRRRRKIEGEKDDEEEQRMWDALEEDLSLAYVNPVPASLTGETWTR